MNWSLHTDSARTTNWFDTHIIDAALKSLGHSLYTDGLINRSDMIALLRSAEDGVGNRQHGNDRFEGNCRQHVALRDR